MRLYKYDVYEVYQVADKLDLLLEKATVVDKIGNWADFIQNAASGVKNVADIFKGGPLKIAGAIKNWITKSGGILTKEELSTIIVAFSKIVQGISNEDKRKFEGEIKDITDILAKYSGYNSQEDTE